LDGIKGSITSFPSNSHGNGLLLDVCFIIAKMDKFLEKIVDPVSIIGI
jgi:hypothetical protein